MRNKELEYIRLLSEWREADQFDSKANQTLLCKLDSLWYSFSQEQIDWIEEYCDKMIFSTIKLHSQEELSNSLINFYLNDEKNIEDVTIKDILAYSANDLELDHYWVQWAFPLKEKSQANLNAPILTDELIKNVISHPGFYEKFSMISNHFFNFLNHGNDKPIWINKNNHNYLRITRVIKSAKLFGRFDIAEKYYSYVRDLYDKWPDDIGDSTFAYWGNAYYENMEHWLK